MKNIIIAEPEIQKTKLSPEDEFLILATDGLWDFMKEREVALFIREAMKTTPRAEICNLLVDYAINTKNSNDNISIVIIFFDHPESVDRN